MLYCALFKDTSVEEYLTRLGPNDRQLRAVAIIEDRGIITNKEFQDFFSVSRETASRDFAELTREGIFKNHVGKGAGSFFKLK
jgi:ATP-dependent DNA helicase RecG